MWTYFHDTRSGGRSKEKWNNILIEAKREDAISFFEDVFYHHPLKLDYGGGKKYNIDEAESLSDVTWFERGCKFIHNEVEFNGFSYLEEIGNSKGYIHLRDLAENYGKILFMDEVAPKGSMSITKKDMDIKWLVIPKNIIDKIKKPILKLCS